MLVEPQGPKDLVHGLASKDFIDLLKRRTVKEVFVMEGRPHLEGAKVLCKTLLKAKITPTLIADNMAGFLFYRNMIKEVWVGYQALVPDGALSVVGALILGVLGKRHQIPINIFPASQPINNQGKPKDVFYFDGKQIATAGIKAYVPLLEVLPKKYITGMIV